MKRLFAIFILASTILCSQTDLAFARKMPSDQVADSVQTAKSTSRLIIPKGEKQAGLHFAYFNLNSANSEYMLLVNAVDAKLSFGTVAPVIAYAYAPNKVIGISVGHTFINGQIDNTTLSLLNDGLDFSLEDLSASAKSSSVSLFHRSYTGLDGKGIFGLFAEFAGTYSGSVTNFGNASDTYSFVRKAALSFSPGVVFFPNQHFSAQVGLSLASLSYSNSTFVKEGLPNGTKSQFKAQANLDLLGIKFGIMLHF